MMLQIRDVDRTFYDRHLLDFLPARMVDVHTHVWLESAFDQEVEDRGATWPHLVASENAIEDLFETYELMFPQQKVRPLIFGSPRRGVVLDRANGYVAKASERHGVPALLVSTPAWSAEALEHRVLGGGFLGIKPYLSFAPDHIRTDEITIYDFLPAHHLEVADAHGWIVMLHIPRRARLRDPVNLSQMLEIEPRYPNVRLVIAHIGRAYCREDVGHAFEALRDTERMIFDFSANTNAWVMEQLIRAVDVKRIMFGSDLPILRMRMRRICENGAYVNLVPPGLYGDVSDDPHMREVSPEEGQRLSFFMYEELLAFRRAAEATGLGRPELEAIFCGNATRLIAGVRGARDGSG